MVIIKDHTPREPSVLELNARKFDNLAAITQELCGDRKVAYVDPKVGISIDLRMSECQVRHGILVIPGINSLIVYNQLYYDLALRLAAKYEQRTKEEFTLEKTF